MTPLVLDAWAVMALFDDEPAAERIEAGIKSDVAIVSWLNLGEAYYVAIRRRGLDAADRALASLRPLIRAELPDEALILAAARIKSGGKLALPEAFCIATAQRHRAPLWTGDPEILALSGQAEMVDLR